MTILKTMNSLTISKKHLSVNEAHFINDGNERNRGRSERASSLALPHSSLLDFYDKQQEQCNSVALLPTNVNVVVRRHSSHYYPMLEEKQQQLQQQQQELANSCSSSATIPITNLQQQQQQQQQQHFNYNIKATNQLLMQDMHLQQSSLLPQLSSVVNNKEIKYITATNTIAAAPVSIIQQAPPETPPPPIPKRTFRGKYSGWNANSTGSIGSINGTGSPTQTPTKSKQQKQQHITVDTAFIYPSQHPQQQQLKQHMLGSGAIEGFHFSTANDDSDSLAQPLFVDITSTRPLYIDSSLNGGDSGGGNLDADGISDDDRMSLENSVFDESLTSTPVKVAAAVSGAAGVGVVFSGGKFSKSFAALTGDLSSAAKRSNRSSSSTVDSTTASSGYGSHSERFASSSTSADFRSRFSSVDTQSSLDSCQAEKTSDSPFPKDSYKMDRATLNDVAMMHEYNNLNNNEIRTNMCNNGSGVIPSNNNTFARQSSTTAAAGAQKLPLVPVRKQYTVPLKIPPPTTTTTAAVNSSQKAYNISQQSLNSNGSTSSGNAPSTVSASTSTSSTASAGSGISSGSAMSISTTTSITAIPPPAHGTTQQQQKRPVVPPIPPTRQQQNSFDSLNTPVELSKPIVGASVAVPPLTIRNKLKKHKPPPIVYPKLHQRQDSNLSSDSFSMTSSPGYNSKNLMDAPLLPNAARINRSAPGCAAGVMMSAMGDQQETDSFGMTASRFAITGFNNAPSTQRGKLNYRQDSIISSDSFSQTSSPGFNTKIMEAPLLPSLSMKRICGVPAPIVVCKQLLQTEPIQELEQTVPMSPLTKCVSTPASLQTIVRFQNGSPSTMSLQHRIVNRRKSSNPYITNGRLKFRLFQILINAFALLVIAGGLAAYFNAYPTIKFVNKTIINTIRVEDVSSFGKNPAPGTCLPIIVKFCQGPQIPYNYTVFPNYIGHFGQLETQVDLDAYEALVDVRCYELVSLYLCSLFVPKCGRSGSTVPPCKTLCTETMRRCGFFFDVFGLSLPEYLNCNLFKDFESSEDCVGLDQVREVMIATTNPICEGFQCDQNRCIPNDYVCDGHLDCMDQADEANCIRCGKDEIYCGDDRCVSSKHICDGIIDCPYGQDERNCIRLSDRNGDLGKGVLEVFRISTHEWTPACVKNWDRAVSPTAVCSMLGYSSVNATSVVTQKTHRPLLTSVNVSTDIWKMYAKKRSNLMLEFSNCRPEEDYPIAELTCANYECGKVKRGRHKVSRRIIGGSQANPGSWPFLAAILGGPEKIFYCAGVLISDQWILTASHCIGNHTVIDLEDLTIQLGVTRRNSFTYSGQKVKVKNVIPHPLYNTAIAHDNDIALFQLSTRVAFHEHLSPVCLPPPSVKHLKPEQMCTVIGWGKREDKDPRSTYEPIVNEVQVPIIRRQQCDEWLDNLTVSDGMICAGYEDGGKDACQGDSGGPLLCPYPGEKDRWFVGGIVSWGIMCAHPKLPGVYANVLKYVPWILEQIQKHSRPIGEDKLSKYDAHPGGPDILSNISTGSIRKKKLYNNKNRSPMDIDYYESDEKT